MFGRLPVDTRTDPLFPIATLFRADWRATVALGGDHRLDIGLGECVADGIGVVALVSEQRVDPLGQHPEQRPEALHVVRLAGRQNEAEWSSLSIAASVELRGEAAPRTADRKSTRLNSSH